MNKIEKTGIVCLVLGVIIATIGFTMANFKIENLNTAVKKEYINKELVSDIKKIKTIEINTRNCEVKVEPIDGDELKIVYKEAKDETYKIDERENLVVKKENSSIFSNIMTFQWMSFETFEKEVMHVYIPKNYAGGLEIINSYAPIILGDFEKLDKVFIKNSQDDIQLNNIKAKSLQLRTSYGTLTGRNLLIQEHVNIDVEQGELQLNQVEAKKMMMDGSYSPLQVEDLKIHETWDATTYQAGLTARKVSAGNIKLSQSYGNFKLYDIKASNELSFHGEQGDMEMETIVTKNFKGEGSYANLTFKHVDIANFNLEMYQGDTNGSLVGNMDDFNIKTAVENGKKNLPDFSSEQHPKKLFVDVSYGDVNITFDKK